MELAADPSRAEAESALEFSVKRDGKPVEVEPYLGAGGHLVALRERDLAYLHPHPAGHMDDGHGKGAAPVEFETKFPTAGSYRLFLQFKHDGEVHTAELTREVAE